jgi:hypothetical protein
MMRNRPLLLSAAILAGVVLLGAAAPAPAALIVRAWVDTTTASPPTFAATDQNVPYPLAPPPMTIGVDNNPAVGMLGLGTTSVPILIGGLQVFGSISTSNSPGAALSQLTSQSLQVVNTTGAGHMVIAQVTDTGYTLPPSPLTAFATASGTFSPVTGTGNTGVDAANARARAWVDTTNTLFGMSTLVQDFSVTAVGNPPLLSYSNSQSLGGIPYSGAYAFTLELAFFLPNNTQLNGRSNVIQAVSAVPEPATLVSALIGLPAVGVFLRRRRKDVAAA